MAEILYTSTDQVVAALGLTSHDLEEQQLLDMDLEPEVSLWLYSWLPTYADVYTYPDDPSSTDSELRQYQHLLLATKYYCAWLVAPRLQMIAPKSVDTEIGNAMSRIDFDPIAIMQTMSDRYTHHMTALLGEISQSTAATSVRGQAVTAVSPAYDPYTATS